MNAKGMIKRNAEKKTKFFYRDRVEVEIIKDVSVNEPDGGKRIVHQKGQIKSPHRLIAEQLVIDGIAKLTPNSSKKYAPNEVFGRMEKSKS
jgi:hypothetical protein